MDKKFMAQRQSLAQMTRDAAELRQEVLEFQGLEREFFLIQDQLMAQYKKSCGIKHPVNRGDAREDHLRRFFIDEGFIPRAYGVTEVSSRVVSSTGHHSDEIDILFYDYFNTPTLIKFPRVEFYPVEGVYGVIQVKSCLRNKDTVKEGLENLASFKRLKAEGTKTTNLQGLTIKTPASRGFGILFAYTATLKWLTIVNAVKDFMKNHPSTEWPNAIVILDTGVILPRKDNIGFSRTDKIDELNDVEVMGIPNYDDCLLRFYSMLMHLLKSTTLPEVNTDNYIRLPLVSDELSYSFSHGHFSETWNCEKHGRYLRQIQSDKLKIIIEECSKATPINWIKATDIAYGQPGDNEEAYRRQPGEVQIYNPDNLPLSDILVFKEGMRGMAFDSIEVSGRTFWIPYCYSLRDNLVTINCPKCKKLNNGVDSDAAKTAAQVTP